MEPVNWPMATENFTTGKLHDRKTSAHGQQSAGEMTKAQRRIEDEYVSDHRLKGFNGHTKRFWKSPLMLLANETLDRTIDLDRFRWLKKMKRQQPVVSKPQPSTGQGTIDAIITLIGSGNQFFLDVFKHSWKPPACQALLKRFAEPTPTSSQYGVLASAFPNLRVDFEESAPTVRLLVGVLISLKTWINRDQASR